MLKEVEEVEAQVRELEYLLKKTRIKYEQFFMGNERREPIDYRGKIRTIIKSSDLGNHRRAAIRFRFMNLCQQYASLSSYWDRVLRMMEDGSFNYLAFRGFQPRVAVSEAGRRARRAEEEGEQKDRVVRLDPEEVAAEAEQMIASNWGEATAETTAEATVEPSSPEVPATPAAPTEGGAVAASAVDTPAAASAGGGLSGDEKAAAPKKTGFAANEALERAARALIAPTVAPKAPPASPSEDPKERLRLKRRRPAPLTDDAPAPPPREESAPRPAASSTLRPSPTPKPTRTPEIAAAAPGSPAAKAAADTPLRPAAKATEAPEPAGEVLAGSRGLYDKYLSAKGSAYRDAEDEMSFGQFEKRLLRKRDTLKKKFQQEFEFDVVNRDGKVSIVARKR
jgi:hypothetical protein